MTKFSELLKRVNIRQKRARSVQPFWYNTDSQTSADSWHHMPFSALCVLFVGCVEWSKKLAFKTS